VSPAARLGLILVAMALSLSLFAAPALGPSYRSLPDQRQDYIPAELIKRVGNPKDLFLRSHVALVFDERDGEVIYKRSANKKMPIASITKLMTAMVVIDANLPMDELITVRRVDRDTIRYSRTRLPVGTTLSRRDLLTMALMASENRAAFALARTYPGGTKAFVKAMNEKARYLGLQNTTFADSAGLRNENTSTAEELAKLVHVASQYSMIRQFTTTVKDVVIDDYTGKAIRFSNTNRLIRKTDWDISLSKTGFTSDAGNCLVMKLTLQDRPLIFVLLNSWGKLSKYGDSNRIKRWILGAEAKVRRLNLI
jgi:serine-type D-Ala-D-Ala endopeptidase (penicillin-binding protein 7)